jgi:putative transposase
MRIRHLNHSVYQIEYHIVFGTKYRRKVLKEYVRTELIKIIKKIQRKYPDWYIPKLNTADDHIHLLIEIPPKYRVSEVVQKIKTQSSIELRKKFKYINKIYDDGNMWSVGYFVSTVGLNERAIKKYIERQNKYDIGVDLTDEFS